MINLLLLYRPRVAVVVGGPVFTTPRTFAMSGASVATATADLSRRVARRAGSTSVGGGGSRTSTRSDRGVTSI